MEIVETQKAPKPIGPYSQGVKSNGFIFISGQISIEPESGKLIKDDIREATKQAIENFLAVFVAGGGKDILKVTIYLTDANNFQAVNEIYERYFGNYRPARATVIVKDLPKGAPIEIEGIASY